MGFDIHCLTDSLPVVEARGLDAGSARLNSLRVGNMAAARVVVVLSASCPIRWFGSRCIFAVLTAKGILERLAHPSNPDESIISATALKGVLPWRVPDTRSAAGD